MYDAYGAYQARSIASTSDPKGDRDGRVIARAVSKFHNSYVRAKVKRLLARLTGRSRALLDLDDVRKSKPIESMHEAGCMTVDVRKIVGSECRVCDFDCDFLPLTDANQQRWVSVYAARLCGVSLPAVSLVQVGDVYYIRDGHHRVSVARLLGEQYIEANVQVWQAQGEAATAPAMSMQLVTVT